jgi:hypothetical protein
MNLPTKLKQEIELYCKVNGIEDIDQFIIRTLKRGFSIEKFGIAPVIDQMGENPGETIDSIQVNIVPKEPIQRIEVDFEIRPDGTTKFNKVEDKKDLYGE